MFNGRYEYRGYDSDTEPDWDLWKVYRDEAAKQITNRNSNAATVQVGIGYALLAIIEMLDMRAD